MWITRLREETTGNADAWHYPSSVAARVVAETLRLEQSEQSAAMGRGQWRVAQGRTGIRPIKLQED